MILTGRAVGLTALGVVPALVWPSAWTVAAWLGLVLVVASTDAVLAASPRRVGLTREVPHSVRLGEATACTVTATNLGTRALRGVLRDAWPPSAGAVRAVHGLDLPAGEARRFTTPLRPSRRGDRVAAGLTVRAVGPLGIAGRQATMAVPAHLRVLPPFTSRRHLPSRLARLREIDGGSAVQIRGEGTEFDSLREYVIGDDVRSIDWRATARRADVVVRTWRPERDRRVMIVLDTSRTSAARIGDEPRLDASIDAALLLAALASRAGDRVELIAFDRVVRARVAGTGGPRLMPALADAMAPLEPALVETDWAGVVAAVHERLSQRALVVLLTTSDPGVVETGLLPVVAQLTRTHQVVLASVADPVSEALRTDRGDSSRIFDAAAAERAELERTAVGELLRQRGVEIVHAGPDHLAPRLADTYLALKAAGRL